MNLDHLKTFRLVAELGSFSKAAEELFLTQPAVSLQIRHLEEELGVKLFETKGRGRQLTEAGSVFLRFVNQVEALLADARREMAKAPAGSRTLSIGCGPTAAKYILPALLAAYRSVAPDTVVQVMVLPLVQVSAKVERGEVDVGILTRTFLVEGFATVPLIRERLVLVAPPDHPIARTPRPSPEDAASYPFVLLSPPSEAYHFIHLWAAHHGVSLRVVMEINSYDALKEAVLQGIGLSLVPEGVIAEDVQRGSLSVIQTSGLPVQRLLYLAYRTNATLPEPVCQLLQTVSERNWRAMIPALTLDNLTRGVPLRIQDLATRSEMTLPGNDGGR